MKIDKTLQSIGLIFFLLAVLAEKHQFTNSKLSKLVIDTSPDIWGDIMFFYWLGAFSEGALLSMVIVSLLSPINIGRNTKIILFTFFSIAVAMTISIRGVLWTF